MDAQATHMAPDHSAASASGYRYEAATAGRGEKERRSNAKMATSSCVEI
jgi:hypothetical protein